MDNDSAVAFEIELSESLQTITYFLCHEIPTDLCFHCLNLLSYPGFNYLGEVEKFAHICTNWAGEGQVVRFTGVVDISWATEAASVVGVRDNGCPCRLTVGSRWLEGLRPPPFQLEIKFIEASARVRTLGSGGPPPPSLSSEHFLRFDEI